MTPPDSTDLGRRTFLIAGGAALLAACSSSDDTPETAPADPTATAEPGATATPVVDSEPTPTTAPEPDEPEADPAEEPDQPDDESIADFTAADFEALAVCATLTDAATGPFPLDEQFDRRDITEGYEGHPLRLGLRVVDSSCTPVPGAAVEIWHTDATGDYSAYDDGGTGKDEAEGTTFCRGTQTADDAGIVEFATIYPGWYPGRTPHIHVRIWVDGSAVKVGQLYFTDDYSAGVYTTGAYAEFGGADTTNATDGLTRDIESDGSLLTLAAGRTRAGEGTVALTNLGIA